MSNQDLTALYLPHKVFEKIRKKAAKKGITKEQYYDFERKEIRKYRRKKKQKEPAYTNPSHDPVGFAELPTETPGSAILEVLNRIQDSLVAVRYASSHHSELAQLNSMMNKLRCQLSDMNAGIDAMTEEMQITNAAIEKLVQSRKTPKQVEKEEPVDTEHQMLSVEEALYGIGDFVDHFSMNASCMSEESDHLLPPSSELCGGCVMKASCKDRKDKDVDNIHETYDKNIQGLKNMIRKYFTNEDGEVSPEFIKFLEAEKAAIENKKVKESE